jgi:hypothetical protein
VEVFFPALDNGNLFYITVAVVSCRFPEFRFQYFFSFFGLQQFSFANAQTVQMETKQFSKEGKKTFRIFSP